MNHRKGSEVCAMKGKIRSVNQGSDCSDSDLDVASVKTLNAFVNGVASEKDKPIYCEMHIRSNPVRWQVDCGATVSIIPKSHISDTQLEPANISLEVWNKEKMNALGTCKLPLQNPKTSQKYMVRFVVVEEELIPVLSPKPAEKMKLITVNYDKFESVNGVVEDKHDTLQIFPDVSSEDTGALPGSVQLTLKPDAEPILCPPKRLPVELRDKVKEELDGLVDTGVLAQVDEPTDLADQMAVATKKDGTLQICIDPRSLNQALKWEN